MTPTRQIELPGARTLGRRGLLAAGAGIAVVVVTGCDPQSSAGTSSGGNPSSGAGAAPDEQVAVTAADAVASALAAVTRTIGAHPRLAGRLAGLQGLHRAHAAALAAVLPAGTKTTARPLAVPHGPAAAVTALVRAEHDLHDSLIGLALRAENGPFARLLGTMAAGLTEQLAVLAR
ncbi:MAG: hypothetical protein JWP74_2368 [Marmoricola sp.]|nr:hypothetical protein [Marmoricola sp.]